MKTILSEAFAYAGIVGEENISMNDERLIVARAYVDGATNSDLVKIEKIKAQIEVISELIDADGHSTINSRIILSDLKQQLKKLENK